MAVIKLIVGLGNPGKKYAKTRHNAGFNVLDLLTDKWGLGWKNWAGLSELCVKNTDERVILAKPVLFMNNSGKAVRSLLDYFGILPEEMLVVSDDFSLELGVLRLRLKGSSGGHNGLASIITETGTSAFPRLRLGIGTVPGRLDPADYVLADFASGEREPAAEMFREASLMIESALALGLEKAVSKSAVKIKDI